MLVVHQRASARDDDIEVAVFRFTLGIPGFDDALIPRFVGYLGVALMLINHLLSPQLVSAPQTRIEVLGAALAALAIAAPTLQQRLEELRPGRGRQAAAATVSGGTNVFALNSNLAEKCRQELAWASYALLKNANTCGVFVVSEGEVLMCRGVLGSAVAGGEAGEVLQKATDSWRLFSGSSSARGLQIYEDRGALSRAGLDECSIIPSGANTVAVLPLQSLLLPSSNEEQSIQDNKESSKSDARVGSSVLVLVSERERALSSKEIKWAQGVASKLHSIL